MLQLYMTPSEKKSEEIVIRFVSKRLLEILDDNIIAFVDMCDDDGRYYERITCDEDWDKPLEEIIDLQRMENDRRFYSEFMAMAGLAPGTVAPMRAVHDFFSLRRLLKAKLEYKPDLSMEYILYAMIMTELDFCKSMPESHKKVKRIPEPDRSIVMKEAMAEAAECKEEDPDLYRDESVEQIAEKLMGYYEDLGQYVMTCFEDTDCLFLDDMDEEFMEKSGFASQLGVNIQGDDTVLKVDGLDDETDFYIPAWELEE